MGVWGGVIFQPRPDFPDTPPITDHLQRYDDRFIAKLNEFWFVIISLLISAEFKLAPLWKISSTWEKKLVILEPQVAIDQRFECQKITKRKINMNINKQAHGR